MFAYQQTASRQPLRSLAISWGTHSCYGNRWALTASLVLFGSFTGMKTHTSTDTCTLIAGGNNRVYTSANKYTTKPHIPIITGTSNHRNTSFCYLFLWITEALASHFEHAELMEIFGKNQSMFNMHGFKNTVFSLCSIIILKDCMS